MAAAGALAATFVVSFAGAVLVHAPLGPTRRLAARVLGAQLSKGISGKVEVERIERLSLDGLEARAIGVRDPTGHPVLFASDVQARLSVRRIVTNALFGGGDVRVEIPWTRAGRVQIEVLRDEDGQLTLAHALRPPVVRPAVPAVPAKPARRVFVDLRSIEVGLLAVRGRLEPLGPIDADALAVHTAMHVGPDGTRVDMEPSALAVRGLFARDANGSAEVHVHVPGPIWGHFAGYVGDVQLAASAMLDGKQLEVRADVPKTSGRALSEVLPGLRIEEQDLRARAEVRGVLPQLRGSATIDVGRGHLEASGSVAVGARLNADVGFDVENLDVRSFSAGAPATSLWAEGHATLGELEGKPRLTVSAATRPLLIAGHVLPAASIAASVHAGALQGIVRLDEPGMPVEAEVRASREGGVAWKASSQIASLDAVPRLRHALKGRARVDLAGSLKAGQFDATLSATLQGLSRGAVRLESGRLDAHAWGRLPDARLDFSLRGRGLAAGAFAWRQVEATLRGPARSPVATLALRDEEAPSVRSSASLQIGKRVDARDVRIALSRAGVDVSILAETVDVRDEVVDLGGLAIDGLGAPMDGVVRVGPRGFDVRLVSTAVDLGRLATLLGGRAPLSGTAALDVDVRNTESVSTGCIRLDARDARVGLMGGVDVSARARLAGSHVDVEANLAAGAQGPVEAAPAHEGACLPAAAVRSRALVSASVNADLALHGSPLRLASWTEARGTARLADVALDLDQIHGLLGLVRKIHPGLAVPDLRGRVAATGELVRDRAGAPPSWALVARSRGLPPLLATGGAARDAAGADIAVTAVMDAEGALRAAACAGTAEAELADGHCSPHAAGVIAKVSAALRLDYERLAREPSSWKQVLLGSRGEARVQVGRHDLARLLAPVFVGSPLPFDARLESADLAVTGTPRDPRIALVASASRPIVLGDPIPVRVELRADYDAARGGGSWVATLEREGAGARDAALPEACIAPRRSEARRPGSRRAHATMAVAQGDVRVRWQDVLAALAGEQGPPGWEVNANVPVEQVHLSDVPMLADADICGVMTGHGWVRGLGRDPHIGLEMSFDQLRVGDGFVYDTGRVAIESRGAGIGGSLSLEAHAPGTRKLISSLSGSFDAPRVRWAHGLVPNVDERHPVRVAVSADRLRAAALQPLVTPVLSYLEGDISGSVEVSVAPGRGASHVEKVDLTLDNGALQIPTLGQELMGISGKARTVARDSVAVDGLRASALSGSLAAAARISFRDLAVYGVSASVATNERNRVRLTLEGVPLGDLYGQAFAVLERPEGLNDVRVELRGVHVDLSDSDTRKVQELGLNPDIAVVPTPESLRAYWVRRAHRGGSDQGASAWESHAPSSPVRAASPWQVSLRLRDPLQVQRAGMRFGVVTPPDARDLPTLVYPEATTGRLAMRGFVGLDGGRIDVFGKRFDVEPERARVSFLGEPGNPALAVTAHWDAPDGTRVFADVTGTLKEPHVQLRSDPAKPQNEILAMILFGTSGSGQATASGQPAGAGGGQAAAGVGGGVAAAGINRILEDVSPVNVSTRVDTSRSSNVRPTLVVEVSRNVFAEATVNTGVAALGQNPDRYMLTLDWRVSRAWSVRTTVGDAGSSILDVLWLHRY